jgi:DNA-binding XRE family transcriptional regulator
MSDFKPFPKGFMSPLTKVMAGVYREQRRARGWSAEVLAGHAGLTRQEIEHIEALRRVPGSDTVERLAEAFEMAITELYALGLRQMEPWPARCRRCNNCCVENGRLVWLNAQCDCTRPGR